MSVVLSERGVSGDLLTQTRVTPRSRGPQSASPSVLRPVCLRRASSTCVTSFSRRSPWGWVGLLRAAGGCREGQQRSGGTVAVPARASSGRDQPACPGGASLWWGFPGAQPPVGQRSVREGARREARRILQQLLRLCGGSTPACLLFLVLGAF